MSDPKLDRMLRELHERLRGLYGEQLDRLVLYGSHARSQSYSGSDVDVLVVLKHMETSPGLEIDRMMEVVYALNLKYDELISVLPISSADFERKQSPLLMNVRREGIVIQQELA